MCRTNGIQKPEDLNLVACLSWDGTCNDVTRKVRHIFWNDKLNNYRYGYLHNATYLTDNDALVSNKARNVNFILEEDMVTCGGSPGNISRSKCFGIGGIPTKPRFLYLCVLVHLAPYVGSPCSGIHHETFLKLTKSKIPSWGRPTPNCIYDGQC